MSERELPPHGSVARARAVQKARTTARHSLLKFPRLITRCHPDWDPTCGWVPDMCDECRQAWNEHQAVWYAANREKIAANRAARKAAP